VWTCPKCQRTFTRPNQRHACGAPQQSDVVRGRPPAIVDTYTALEAFARSLGPVEVVARDRYVLFRSTRIFTDLSIMTDAVRVAIHLGRRVDVPIFFKIAEDRRHTTHVAKIRSRRELDAVLP
jgi:hypothetical protein